MNVQDMERARQICQNGSVVPVLNTTDTTQNKLQMGSLYDKRNQFR